MNVTCVQTAAPGWRFESESPASNDAFTARRRSNRSVEFTRPFSQANFDGGFCANLCANPSRSGNVTRRRHFGPTFFTRYDSEHPPSHPAAPPQPSGRLRAPFHLPGHQKPTTNPFCHRQVHTFTNSAPAHVTERVLPRSPFSYFSHRTSYDSKHLVPRLTHVSYQTVNTYKTKGVFSGLTGWSRDAPPPFK